MLCCIMYRCDQANTGQQGPPGAPGENGMDGHRVSHLQTPSYFLDTYLYIYDIVNATLWASSEVSLKWDNSWWLC